MEAILSTFEEDIVQDFIIESREHLISMEADLLMLESEGVDENPELVNKLFRAAHSIKGSAGALNFQSILELSHLLESILDKVRNKAVEPDSDVIQCLLRAFDRVGILIEECTENQNQDISDITGCLQTFLDKCDKSNFKKESDSTGSPKKTDNVDGLRVSELENVKIEVETGKYVYKLKGFLQKYCEENDKKLLQWLEELEACGSIIQSEPEIDDIKTMTPEEAEKLSLRVLFTSVLEPDMAETLWDGFPEDSVMVCGGPGLELSLAVPAEIVAEPLTAGESHQEKEANQDLNKKNHKTTTTAAPEETLRVNVKLLERLMNLAGELVLGRNQLLDAILRGDARILKASGSKISSITSELQEAIMLTRMQPVGLVMSKCQRLVRDLAHDLGKKVELDITGRDVEMDKAIVESLADPLMHMLRNSLDHGLEATEERIKKGKSESGHISLRAYHAAGQVVIEVEDDGKGIDSDRIASSAMKKNLITGEDASVMTSQELLALIFQPGFSTAEKITDVSGRGVGMDVVKSNIDRLGGTIVVDSEPGSGTKFKITLPLTLAIIPSLLLSAGGEKFAVPQVNVKELIRIPAAQVKNRVELVGDQEVLKLRNNLLPFVRLTDVLGIPEIYTDPETGETSEERRSNLADRRSRRVNLVKELSVEQQSAQRCSEDRRFHAASDLNIAVLSSGAMDYALAVDVLHDTVEIVVRPLGEHLKKCREYAGATILGDGQVAIILDVAGLAARADLEAFSDRMHRNIIKVCSESEVDTVSKLLLFHNSPDEPCVLPLNRVVRLEGLMPEQIENINGVRTMQCRGLQLKLLFMNDFASMGDVLSQEELMVAVINSPSGEFGIVGAGPLDIVEYPGSVDETHSAAGIKGSCLIRNMTTLLVDVDYLGRE